MSKNIEEEVKQTFRGAHFQKEKDGIKYYRIIHSFVPGVLDRITICVTGDNAGWWHLIGTSTTGDDLDSLKRMLSTGSGKDIMVFRKAPVHGN